MKNKEAYASAIIKYGLTDNMEVMVTNLIKRSRNVLSINIERKNKIPLLKYIYANTCLSLSDYLKERDEVLKYLQSFNGEDYFKILEEVGKLNTSTFYYYNKDDKYVRTDSVEVISLDDNEDGYSNAIDYKNKKDGDYLYLIPVSSKTTRISNDLNFRRIITDRLNEYKRLIELNNIVQEINSIKERLSIKKDSMLEQKYNYLKIEYNRDKTIISDCISNNEGLIELVKNEYTKKYGKVGKLSYNQALPIIIEVYKSTILPKMVKDAINYLIVKNNDSKEYCESVLTSLNSEIIFLDCGLNNDSELLNYQFILDVLDNIYPGIRLELSDALKNCDLDKVNSILDTIEQVLYLDDTEKVLVK